MWANESQETVGKTKMVAQHGGTVELTPATAPPLTAPMSPFKVQPLVGPIRCLVQCPFCLEKVRTFTETTITTRTHTLAFNCCFFCCCCLPYCMNSAKNIDHFCPSCKGFLGTYKK